MDIYQTLEDLSKKQDKILELLNSEQEKSDLNRVYDLTELGQILQVSRRTISTWTKQGILPCTKVSNKIWVTGEQLNSFLEDNSSHTINVLK